MAGTEFGLEWKSSDTLHRDRLYFPRLDFWRDILPGTLAARLEAAPVGTVESEAFAAGELVPAFREADVRQIRDGDFQRRSGGVAVEPRVGRFYPRGMIAGVAGIFPGEFRPFRVLEADGRHLTVDLNHPLARFPLTLTATIVKDLPPRDQRGGSCTDIAETVAQKGPGLQATHPDVRTDFFHDYPFRRLDDNPDTVFYQMPRLVEHVDAVATRDIGRIYGRLLKPGARILDLMSSWVSHLPEDLPLTVSGLGLNEEELAQNPRLADYALHDLNRQSRLPYGDSAFDAVICTNSVEYLTQPLEVFRDVARVLRPGGLFINCFSERWFPPKVISVWTEIHPFERMGLVLEALRRTEAYRDLHSESVRGYLRPDDDKYRGMTPNADPVYAVWAVKAA
jgi:SAM-dependent methyltransferase